MTARWWSGIGGGNDWQHQVSYQGPRLASRVLTRSSYFAKWATYHSLEHEFLVSIAAQIDLPTGNTGIQESSHTSPGPVFLWEKEMGDLPSSPVVKYLRPLAIQTDFAYVPAWMDLLVMRFLQTQPSSIRYLALATRFRTLV